MATSQKQICSFSLSRCVHLLNSQVKQNKKIKKQKTEKSSTEKLRTFDSEPYGFDSAAITADTSAIPTNLHLLWNSLESKSKATITKCPFLVILANFYANQFHRMAKPSNIDFNGHHLLTTLPSSMLKINFRGPPKIAFFKGNSLFTFYIR